MLHFIHSEEHDLVLCKPVEERAAGVAVEDAISHVLKRKQRRGQNTKLGDYTDSDELMKFHCSPKRENAYGF
jgi:hypothetical protein